MISLLITKREHDAKVDALDRRIKELQAQGQPVTFDGLVTDLGLQA